MIIGVLSDTHEDKAGALPFVLAEFRKRNVAAVVHCGDIEPQHLGSFGDYPVICALNREQLDKPPFNSDPPKNWIYTKPDDRVRSFNGQPICVSHKRSFDFLTGAEGRLAQFIETARRDNDGLRWYFSGHTHNQIFVQSHSRMVSFVNPGAVAQSSHGYEFAVADTENS